MRDVMLILHFIGIALAIGAGFSNLFLGRVAAKLEPAERGAFMSKIVALAVMGRTGLGLLLLTGFALMTPFWKTLSEMPTLIAKLSMVGILTISVIILSILVAKAQKQGNMAMMAKLRKFAILNFFLGIAILILAVITFH